MLAVAKRKRSSDSQCPRFILHDLRDALPFEDAAFDAVISVMVLYALPSPRSAVRELVRVLRPGGALVLVNACKPVEVLGALGELRGEDGMGAALAAANSLFTVGLYNLVIARRQRKHTYHYTSVADLRKLLVSHGLEVRDAYTTYSRGTAVLASCIKGGPA
jgi:ubiquinone/menaquinone biosynthesis C-methylase UbiE